MEEEEARLKALLEQTEDLDERRKIRADLRAVRKKMLDSLSATAEAESTERAARRAERARARKADEEPSYSGPVITDQILAEIDDEGTLQKLLDEIPPSQIEDRRKIRAKIREVKRKRAEEDDAAPRRTRRAKETTETLEQTSSETSHVTITSTSGEAPSVTIETTHDKQSTVTIETEDEPADKIPFGEPPAVTMDMDADETSGVAIETVAGDASAVTIETTSVSHEEDGMKFKLTLRQSKLEQDNEDIVEQSNEVDIDRAEEVVDEEPSPMPVEMNIEHGMDGKGGGIIESQENEKEELSGNAGISVQVSIDGEVNLSTDEQNEADLSDGGAISKDDVEGVSSEGRAMNDHTYEREASKGATKEMKESSNDASHEKISSTIETKTSKGTPGSRWPPQDDEKKKLGRVNQVDFRTNLKKSGKIGTGVVNLEKKNATTGTQVDFRAGNLKKSGKIGPGKVNLESKISTQGAQVDFRSSSLKSSGKLGSGPVNLERKTTQSGAQVDFRAQLKKGGSPQPSSSKGVEKSLNKNTPLKKTVEKSVECEIPVDQSSENVELKVEEITEGNSKDEEVPSEIQSNIPGPEEIKDKSPAPKEKKISPPVEKKIVEKEPSPVKIETKTNGVAAKDKVIADENLKIDNVVASPALSENENKEVPSVEKDAKVVKDKEVVEDEHKTKKEPRPRDSYKTREETKNVAGRNKLSDRLSKFQAKNESPVKPKSTTPMSRSSQRTQPAADKAVNGLAVEVEKTSITPKEPEVQVEVTEHVEDDGDTHTEVREEKSTTQDGDVVEEKTEVTTKKETTVPGGKFTTQTKETTTKTTGRRFMDPEIQKKMAARQRERAAAKREQASSAKNKRMAFMQKLEANSPAQKGPTNIKRSGSNVDKLLTWCRFKLRNYEGVNLNNFSSSWGDGLAFCALIHLYLPDKIPYEELVAGGDRRRNFEVAFSAATEAGVPELLEVDDMISVANPEPKSVMTYVSSIYKHFNPS